jgi:hypothetical protein
MIANVTNICPINSLVGVIEGSAAGPAPAMDKHIGGEAESATDCLQRTNMPFDESRPEPRIADPSCRRRELPVEPGRKLGKRADRSEDFYRDAFDPPRCSGSSIRSRPTFTHLRFEKVLDVGAFILDFYAFEMRESPRHCTS